MMTELTEHHWLIPCCSAAYFVKTRIAVHYIQHCVMQRDWLVGGVTGQPWNRGEIGYRLLVVTHLTRLNTIILLLCNYVVLHYTLRTPVQ